MFLNQPKGLGPIIALCLMATPILSATAASNNTVLTLEQTVRLAQKNDPWLSGNRHRQAAIDAQSVAAGTMADPKMSIGLANLATDSFDFDQEGMTQLKVGVSQMLPRGDSLAIKQRQLSLKASQYPFQRQNRHAKVAVTVAQLWLNGYKAQQSITLIEQNRALFEQLADIAQASYSSAIGKTRQQDIVRAQLELTRLEDRLMMLHQQQEMFVQQLGPWLSDGDLSPDRPLNLPQWQLSSTLPDVTLLEPQLYSQSTAVTPTQLYGYLAEHPAVKAVAQKIKASDSNIALAKEKYKPQWGLNASYGYRDNMPTGGRRADFLSVGVSFDLPFFTDNRQDQQLQSAVSQTEAIKTEKLLLLRQLMAGFNTAKARLVRFNQRQNLYQVRLLPQIHEQAEAALTAYTNDAGDFAEVVRARIAELNGQIDALGINVERQKTIIQLNYFFTGNHMTEGSAQ